MIQKPVLRLSIEGWALSSFVPVVSQFARWVMRVTCQIWVLIKWNLSSTKLVYFPCLWIAVSFRMLSYLKCFKQCDFHFGRTLNILDQKTVFSWTVTLADTASLVGCVSMRAKIITASCVSAGLYLQPKTGFQWISYCGMHLFECVSHHYCFLGLSIACWC